LRGCRGAGPHLDATEHVIPPAIREAAAQIGQTLEAVQQTPGSFPAFSVVIVHGADAPLIEVHVSTPRKLDPGITRGLRAN